MSEEVEAAKEIAKTAGKVIDAGSSLGKFFGKYLDQPLTEISAIATEKLAFRRWKNAMSMADEAARILEARGLQGPTKEIPLNVAVPLLEAASLEEREDLRSIFAKLLANGADADSGVDLQRMYVSIAQELTSRDARNLKAIYDCRVPSAFHEIPVWNLPNPPRLEDPKHEAPSPEVQLSLENLIRLQLISNAMAYGGSSPVHAVYQSTLGRKFYEACIRD